MALGDAVAFVQMQGAPVPSSPALQQRLRQTTQSAPKSTDSRTASQAQWPCAILSDAAAIRIRILRTSPLRNETAPISLKNILKNYQYSTEGQKLQENLAPVLVIISWKSLVFSRKIITSTGFYRHCGPDARNVPDIF